jgi:hemerythrin-like domain-containing protein
MKTCEEQAADTCDLIGLLKCEHRLILRMTAGIERALRSYDEAGRMDPRQVAAAAQFMCSYADLCHHGKEEGILFRALERKPLEPPLRALMAELVQEHAWARSATKRLTEANEAAAASGAGREEVERQVKLLRQLRHFYQGHITKEESRFFNRCLQHLSRPEQQQLCREFAEFEDPHVHDTHRRTLERLEKELER